MNLHPWVGVSLAAALALAAGCTVEERMEWSPDGSRAAVVTPEGLCLADPGGALSAPLVRDVTRAAWLPDGRGLALLRESAVTNWAEVCRRVPRSELVPVEALAGALPALLRSALAASGGRYEELGAQVFEPLHADGLPLQEGLLCLRDAHPRAWAELLAALGTASTNRPAAEQELNESAQAMVREVCVLRLEGGRPAGPPVVTECSLRRLAEPRPSPAAPVLAYLRDDTLTVAPLDGGTGRVAVAERVAGSFDWTPDGRSLVFAARLAKEWDDSGVNLARILRCAAVASNGTPAAGTAEPLAASAFRSPPRVRCLPDGRVLFAGLPANLPAADVAGAARFYLLSAGAAPEAVGPAELPVDPSAFALSPDGRRVAMAESGSDVVAVLELAGGAVRILSPRCGAKSRTLPAWRGGELYFAALPAEGARRADWMRCRSCATAPAAFSAGWPAGSVEGLLELPSAPASAPAARADGTNGPPAKASVPGEK